MGVLLLLESWQISIMLNFKLREVSRRLTTLAHLPSVQPPRLEYVIPKKTITLKTFTRACTKSPLLYLQAISRYMAGTSQDSISTRQQSALTFSNQISLISLRTSFKLSFP